MPLAERAAAVATTETIASRVEHEVRRRRTVLVMSFPSAREWCGQRNAHRFVAPVEAAARVMLENALASPTFVATSKWLLASMIKPHTLVLSARIVSALRRSRSNRHLVPRCA